MASANYPSRKEALEAAIAAQQALRGTLADELIDLTLSALNSQLAELEAAQNIKQQRKLLTLVFVDVENSTHMLASLDPEEQMALMDGALKQMAIPIESRGGQILRYMGDGFLAAFGMLQARENDPEMAVLAGLSIVADSQKIAAHIREEWGVGPFHVRVGINTGIVMIGGMTEALNTIMGTAINLAARLESMAPPDGILISHFTYQHIRGLFDFDSIAEIDAKGFDDPVRVYQVKQALTQEFRMLTRGVEGTHSTLVGRQSELAELRRIYEETLAGGELQQVTIMGVGGIGKSRLVLELENSLAPEPSAAILRARATQEMLSLPFAFIKDLLQHHFAGQPDGTRQDLPGRVAACFAARLGENQASVKKAQMVAQFMGAGTAGSEGTSPEQLYNQVVMVLAEYLSVLAVDNPLVILLDDIHWADESSLEMLSALFKELAGLAVFVIANTRPLEEERGSLMQEDGKHSIMRLEPLGDQDVEALLNDLLEQAGQIPEELSSLMIEKAEGNPFYLEELINMFIEKGVITHDGAAWQIHAANLDASQLPTTLTGVVQVRLDTLSENQLRTLQQASVIGRVFWDTAVEHINLHYSARQQSSVRLMDVPRNLTELQEKAFVNQREASTFRDCGEYIFSHSILREATYESIVRRRRKQYHNYAAEWFIAQGGGGAEFAGVIAAHLENAGEPERALDYYCQAGEAALNDFAVNEAGKFYQRALALVPADDLQRRFDLLVINEKVYGYKGDREAQREVIQQLYQLAEGLEDKPKLFQATLLDGWLHFWKSTFEEGLIVVRRAIDLAEELDNPGSEVAAYYLSAWIKNLVGAPHEALQDASHGLDLARQHHMRTEEGNLLNALNVVAIHLGDFYASKQYVQEFLTIAQETNNKEREATARGNIGATLTALGELEQALEHLQIGYQLSLEMGNQSNAVNVLVNLSWLYTVMEDWPLAIETAQEGIRLKRAQGHNDAVGEGLIWLGHAYTGYGEAEQALPCYQESLAIREELGQDHLVMESYAGLAQAYLALGEGDQAREVVEKIMAHLEAGGSLQGSWERTRIYSTCFAVLRALGDPRAAQMLDTAYQAVMAVADNIPDEAIRAGYLQNIPWHRDLLAAWDQSNV